MQKIAQKTIYDYHRASFYHIFRYRGNENYHYIGNKKIKVVHNSLLIINSDVIHRYSKHKCRGDMILFDTIFFTFTEEKADFLNQCTLFKVDYIVIPPKSENFRASISMYFSLMKSQIKKLEIQERDIILLRNWVHNLLIIIEREYQSQKKQIVSSTNFQCYMEQFKNLLNIHYQTEKRVHFYADKLHLSDRELTKIVFYMHGISAKEYIREKIQIEAILLLESTTLNLSEITTKLGLDYSYFVRFFKKHFNITPGKYRRGK
ncbi:MAG: helix-turn-helix domain-containing protein [Prevotella sp.]|nr:helix-turn-helix domain-containing protein [Prevotella sp.]